MLIRFQPPYLLSLVPLEPRTTSTSKRLSNRRASARHYRAFPRRNLYDMETGDSLPVFL